MEKSKTSSPRFCRPIKIQFLHETTEVTINEVSEIEEQIIHLKPLETVIGGKEVVVKYNLNLTMVDGKVCNAVTHTASAQRCFLCGATSKQFNDLDMIAQKEVNQDHVRFGLSTLHAWIRFFECCLHLSYKLGIQKWQARNHEEKEKVQERKRIIQNGLRCELGLVVDMPKPGFGTTNDGNTARRFFEDYKISALVTGVDETLIKRFYIILQVISSGFGIDSTKFYQYSMDTAKLYVDLYPWYYMPTSVHKLLIHGAQIIQTSNLPIGQMSEDAQESLNKCIKKFRENLSRKSSRLKTMEDVMHRLLLNSDPYISSFRKLPKKKLRSLFPEAIALLQTPEVNNRIEETEPDADTD
ncbi:uncharacterized protein LOC143215029 [Lasioglossum baleicum]|uniref:uncharacterized protein LOC143215029 n=1 Tax=Lasioglossum baleicum TaxID=434251 RepID=UPI003FCC314B